MLLFISEFWSETPVVPSIIHSMNKEVLVYGYYVIISYYYKDTQVQYMFAWRLKIKEVHTVKQSSKKRAP